MRADFSPLPAEHWPAPGSDLYYATVLLPPALKLRIAALEALKHTLAKIPLEASDPGIARIKLAWWREELGRLRAGQARHPLAQTLLRLELGAAAGAFEALSAALDDEVGDPYYDSADDLHEFFASMYAPLWRQYGAAAGISEAATLERVSALGVRVELGYCLLHLRRHLAARVYRVPKSHCPPAHGVEELFENRSSPAVQESIREFGAAVLRDLAGARDALANHGDRRLLFPLARARILERTLAEAERGGFRVLDERVTLTPLRKFLSAWRVRLTTR
jgi:phytoene synthase